MARVKNITRTIVTGYAYDAMKRTGDTLVKVKEVITESPIRSIKQQTEVLLKNGLQGDHVLVQNRTIEKQYVMDEETFIKYSKEVTEIPPADNKEKSEETDSEENAEQNFDNDLAAAN